MFNRSTEVALNDSDAMMSALDKSQAVISFKPDGTILDANKNFLGAVGYSLNEIRGQHHSMFVHPDERNSPAYQSFWRELASGEFKSAEFQRIAKGGKEIWIQASYNPIKDPSGRTFKVTKFATDITAQKMQQFKTQGQIDAINRSQAVIEFTQTGEIINANENFLAATGYALSEIRGKHHSMFMDPVEAKSPNYASFWRSLSEGQIHQAEYRRLGKGGREIWIQASYNPILDARGNVTGVVKFASDITDQVVARKQREELQRQIDADLNTIAASITQSTARSNSVASASDQTSNSVNNVAAGAEELAASTREISEQLARQTQITREAVQMANETNAVVSGLTESAEKISEVVKLISDIAQQTNLLALNATIEAARAGEAGRGFAVVANEVKGLAVQSARATEEIAGQITQVQSVTGQAATAISSIGGTISEIDDVASAVASAVEEQSSVTAEITDTMQNVAGQVDEINESIREIAEASSEMERSTNNLRDASARMAS